MRRTKLIATLGPSTDAPGVLEALVSGGLDVARLNTSHGTRQERARRLESLRAAAASVGRQVGAMLDLGGAKVRLGAMQPGVELVTGELFSLLTGVESDVPGDRAAAWVNHAGLAADVAPGDRILLDDGRIELVVERCEDDAVHTRVEAGGPLASRKGLNVPGVTLAVDSITARDLDELAWGLDAGIDLVAQSFVRSAADVVRLRDAMGPRAVPIVAKIEKHEAVGSLDEIVRAADAVMVARGDLGVELSPEAVPVVQRRVIDACRSTGTPVIVATQMLESMTDARRPTRAEASDVANAIFAGVDAVMLSGETAVGRDPAHVLATMDRIVQVAEAEGSDTAEGPTAGGPGDVARAVSRAACDLARDLDLAAIVTATQSGATARAVAAHRPRVPVVAATPDAVVARQLTPVWGVRPVVVGAYDTADGMVVAAADAARASGLAHDGDLIAVTGGVAVHVAGSTDFVQVHRL